MAAFFALIAGLAIGVIAGICMCWFCYACSPAFREAMEKIVDEIID